MTRIFGEWSRARGVVLSSLLGLSGLCPEAMAHAQTPAAAGPAAPAAKQTPAQGKLTPQMPPGAPAKPFRFPKPETKTLATARRPRPGRAACAST